MLKVHLDLSFQVNCGLKPKFLTTILGHVPELYQHHYYDDDNIIRSIITVEITSGTLSKRPHG